jgi:hypothetical protein
MFYNTCITEMSVVVTKKAAATREAVIETKVEPDKQQQKQKLSFKHITHTFLSGKLSSTLIIPIQIARRYGIDQPSNVIVEELGEKGILIKKLDI